MSPQIETPGECLTAKVTSAIDAMIFRFRIGQFAAFVLQMLVLKIIKPGKIINTDIKKNTIQHFYMNQKIDELIVQMTQKILSLLALV